MTDVAYFAGEVTYLLPWELKISLGNISYLKVLRQRLVSLLAKG
jgi:hypothetical protein